MMASAIYRKSLSRLIVFAAFFRLPVRRLAVCLLSILIFLMLELPAAAQTPPRALSPLLDRFGNSCQTLLPCAAMEHLGLFLGTSGQVALTDSKAGRSYTFGGDLSLGFDFIRRVALEARFPVAGLRDPAGSYRLIAGPSMLGLRVRLGPAAATLFGTRKPPRYSLLLGTQLVFRLPRAEGDPQHVGALPLGAPQPRFDVAGELNFGPAQVSPSLSVMTEQGGAMLQLGLRTSMRLHSGVSVDIEALSRMRVAGPDEAGRCTGGTRGALGIRGVLATGVLAFAHYSVGSGDCEPTHAAVAGVSFAFGGLPLRRIPTPEEVGASDFWQRVYLGIADPVLDCNGWMLDDKSLVPLFKFGDPDPMDPTVIRSHGEVFRVGEHFDIDRQRRLYRANLLRQPLFGGQSFTDAPVSQKLELPVCEQGPRHRFAEHCQILEKTIEQIADAVRSEGGHGWTATMSQQWVFERECLGGKDDEERGRLLSDILRVAQLLALKRARPSGALGGGGSPAGVRGTTGGDKSRKEGAYHGPKPEYENPGHHDPSSGNFRGGGSRTSRLPEDAEKVFERAIPEPDGRTWWGRNAQGEYYRYQGQNGKVHWNGRENSERGLAVPEYIRKRFGGR